MRIVGEAIDTGWVVETLIVSPELLNSLFGQQLVSKYQSSGGHVLEVSADVFCSLSSKDGPQGLGAVVAQKWSQLEETSLGDGNFLVALDSIQDPGNLGTIMRTLDAVGGQGIILLDQSTDPFDPAAVRGSMGALFSLELIKTSYVHFAEWKKFQQLPVIGASDKAASDYHYAVYPGRFVLLMGSERLGLQEHHLALCDQVVRIPMVGSDPSFWPWRLQLSYAVYNQWRDQNYPNQLTHKHTEVRIMIVHVQGEVKIYAAIVWFCNGGFGLRVSRTDL